MAGPVRRSSLTSCALVVSVLGISLALAGATQAVAQSSTVALVEIPYGEALLADGPAWALAGLGDINADGRSDFVLGFPKADTAQGADAGRVLVISGLDRSVLFTFEGHGPHDNFGYAVAAAGDVNGDGTRDVLVGAPYGSGPTYGYAQVFSGLDGSVLLSLHQNDGGAQPEFFGEFVAGDADIDGDGRADVVVCQTGNFSDGLVRVHSGTDGALLNSFPIFFLFGGGLVGTLGDVDHDGHDEILIGAQGEANFYLQVYSGADGRFIHGFFDVGGSASDAGDVDQDGVSDLLLGTGEVVSGATWTTLLQLPGSGVAHGVGDIDGDGVPDLALGNEIFSGADGQYLSAAAQAWELMPAGDVDGDGRADVLGRSSYTVLDEATSPAGLFRSQAAQVSTWNGSVAHERFGTDVANAGDLDHDGYADLLVGIPLDDTHGVDAGSVHAISGADGSLLFELAGLSPHDEFGTAVASAGDVDGDGRPDIVVGTPLEQVGGTPQGSARVYSGADGHLLFAVLGPPTPSRFGHAVAAAGDVNGDGFADIVVGDPQESFLAEGSVSVLAGPAGDLLFKVPGDAFQLALGSAVAGAGDVDGDGLDDILVGAPGAGEARVLSGSGGGLVRSFESLAAERDFGETLATLGDLDGDDVRDFVIGSRFVVAPGSPVGGPPKHYDRAVVVSGASGARLFTWTASLQGPKAGAPALGNAGDVDGDGTTDVIAGRRTTDTVGFVDVHSGASGAAILALSGATGDGVGASVAGGDDTNGDGLADVIIGAPGDDTGGADAGAVRVLGHSAVAPPWSFLGKALLGSQGLPILLGSGTLQPSSGLSLHLSRAAPHTRTALVIGLHALSLPFKGGTLVPFPDLVQWPILTTGDGSWDLAAHWPVGVPPGLLVLFQSWVVDPAAVAGYAASNALQVETP